MWQDYKIDLNLIALATYSSSEALFDTLNIPAILHKEGFSLV